MHHHILINEKLGLSDQMATYSNNIRKIINRNKKFVIHLAVAETIRHGGSIYEFRIEDYIDHEDESSKKNITQSVNPEVIVAIVEEKMQAIGSQVETLVEEKLKPTKAWMTELQDQIMLRSLEEDKRFEDIKKTVLEGEVRHELS